MSTAHKILNAAVLLIGLYMIITYWGAITPPLLSGAAFVILGASAFLLKK